MVKLLIQQGLPASGKSTDAKKMVNKNSNIVRICRDDLRYMRGKYWIPKQKSLITAWEDSLIITTLNNGYDVILDATNLNDNRNKNRVEYIKEEVIHDIDVKYIYYPISVVDAIERDKKRENSVGEDVILNMHKKHISKYKPDITNPKGIIYDIDGTLSIITDRYPYDWDKVGLDAVNNDILHMLYYYKEKTDYKIIIVTGRDGICKEDTLEWLNRYEIPYDDFYIKPVSDNTKGYKFKEHILLNELMPKYNITHAIDDRIKEIYMYKSHGIKTIKVNYED